MKLLFNKDDAGNDEFKELLGYIDADLNFDNLKPDVNTSTNDIVNLIGTAVYDVIADAYASATDHEFFKTALFAARYPIAVNTYRLYAPTNDLSHTNDGRKMRSDSNEKSAFEWMIDRDNSAQEKRYYRSLDDLILFLDNLRPHSSENAVLTADQIFENDLRTAWRTSENFEASHQLFIRTVKDFDDCFPINSRLLLMKVSPGINDCEYEEILPRIGVTKFDELKTILKSGLPVQALDKLLLKQVRKACASYSLAWALPRYSVNLFPDGVLQHYTSDRATTRGQKPAVKLEVEAAVMAFKSDFTKAVLEIERLVKPTPIVEPVNINPRGESCEPFFST